MKKSYMMVSIRKVELNIYPESKYTYRGDECDRKKYNHGEVASWDIIEGEDAKAMCKVIGMDECKELLVLHMSYGSVEVYNNSMVDMFAF